MMLGLILIPLSIFGLAVGSFLNCVIYRLGKKKSFLKGRSFCPHCRHGLSWLDLIPVFSFFLLKAKCRYCHKKISWQYPLVELATALLFVLVGCRNLELYGYTNLWLWHSGFLLVISAFLIVIFVYDLKHYLIPDKVIFPAIAVAFLYHSLSSWFFGSWNSWFYGLGAAFGAMGFFLLIFLISRGNWLGFGDVKLVFFLGLILGWPNVLAGLFLSFMIGALIGTILIFFGKKGLKSEVPFAPFLVMGTLIALFWGEKFVSWYFNFIII